MKQTLRHQLDRLGLRLAELDASLADNAVASDIKRFRALSKEQADVAEVVGLYRRYLQREEDLDVAQGLLEEPDMAEMAREEISQAEADMAQAVGEGPTE